MESPHTKKSKWRIFVFVLIIISVGLLIYFGYKEPDIEINSSTLKLKGLYGVNLLFTEIAEIDTISWNEMPMIAMRTNGISIFRIHRGKYKTTKDEKIYLNIYSGISPLIRIIEQNGSAYYINRKNTEETRQMFKKLKKTIQ